MTESVYVWDVSIEAPAIWKKNDMYFMFGSYLTGWDPNDNVSLFLHVYWVRLTIGQVYSYAETLSGPWSEWMTFADVGSKTYNSQTTYILPFGDSAIYMGDRWHSDNLMTSTYIWLPLSISGTSISMTNPVNWVPNVASSTWALGPSETHYEGEDAVLTNGATSVSCSGCSGAAAAGYVGGPDGGTVSFSSVSSDASTRTTIRVKHTNGDSSQRHATVSVNGVGQDVAFLPTGGQTPGSSSVHCDLVAGENTVIVAMSDGSYGPDLDGIYVPVK